ncbi:hypothetical protein LUZ61_011533 [Rhynchospora tenuis]|uniref:Reverse transcriptase domain-containing protein n=1 Tax=Rhynchospora tenuis TaxID=198213 RepID=A0AAD6A1N3_9POAL|nr:hypothetical protein LUZ61_011533 [Rhynchospora tenuis]
MPPDENEIRAILNIMEPESAPGPDGYTAKFLQQLWPIIKEDLVNSIRKCFEERQAPADWLKCNLILIPKKPEAAKPEEYRPISIGDIHGIKLTPVSTPITHILYADDLLITGPANTDEIINLWGAQKAKSEEKYLGVTLHQPPKYRSYNAQALLHKFNKALGGWKAHTLSYAGRLVLLKSVLLSLPVYAFSVNLYPKVTIRELTSLARKFFWGKTQKNRFLSMIAWDKITIPVTEGGLGVKDLNIFNNALMLKMVWRIASNQNNLWVQIIKDKYCGIKGFWGSSNTKGCSLFWKNLQKLKPYLKDHIYWTIGDGNNILVRGDPWFDNWTNCLNLTRKRNCFLSEAIDSENQCWKANVLKDMLPVNVAQQIMLSDPPILNQQSEDTLCWQPARNKFYSVKEGYMQALKENDRSKVTNCQILPEFDHLRRIYEKNQDRIEINWTNRINVSQAHQLAEIARQHSLLLNGYPTAKQLAKMKCIPLMLAIKTKRKL